MALSGCNEQIHQVGIRTMDENAREPSAAPETDLQQQLESARQQAADHRDKYLRALAECENTRKRMDRMCEERLWQERKRLFSSFLEVVDHLEEALKYASDADPIGVGIRATYQQVQKMLSQEGVRSVPAVGATFDPAIHEAVEIAEGAQAPNQVLAEYRKGYTLDGKLLRPARVKVSQTK
jgi:molecular chaperone GrpE